MSHKVVYPNVFSDPGQFNRILCVDLLEDECSLQPNPNWVYEISLGKVLFSSQGRITRECMREKFLINKSKLFVKQIKPAAGIRGRNVIH